MPNQPSKRRGGRSDDAVWCEQHGRRECAKNTKKGVRCHQIAIEGLDACKLHCGEKLDHAKARGQANLARQRFRDVDPGQYIDPGSVLAWAVTVAFIDIADYRHELAEQVAGGKAVSDVALDRLMRMQSDAARISKFALDAGVNERAVKIAEETAAALVTVIRGVLGDLGHDTNDPAVQAVVRRRLELAAPGAA